ncbi:MAG TPA: PilZ domain-containing protein [Bdellovibrionota bacterium]|nr:PilZ domain-containing protein [Bdellovibrionota bacterium]
MASFREQGPTERFEKRKHFRFAVQLPVQLGFQRDDMSSICTNLSWQGVSVETALRLTVSERLAVTVTIAPKEEPLRMLGQVVWKRDTGAVDTENQPVAELGIRFLRPLPSPWKTYEEDEMEFDPRAEEDLPQIIPFRRA